MSIGLPTSGEQQLSSPPSANQTGILIVDEDPAFQLGLKTFLREYVGFEKVYTAANGRDAIDLIEADESIELVTLDYQMPGLTGIEVLGELRNKDIRPLNVMMVTGYPSEELEEEFFSFRGPRLLTSKFLSKPIEFEMLEPLMLSAYEELTAAKEAESKPAEDEPKFFDSLPSSDPGAESSERIAKMEVVSANNEKKIAQLESQLEKEKKAGKKRTWLIVLAALGIWLASDLGLLAPVGRGWESFKQEIRAAVQSGIQSPASVPEETAPEQPDSSASDSVTPSDPVEAAASSIEDDEPSISRDPEPESDPL